MATDKLVVNVEVNQLEILKLSLDLAQKVAEICALKLPVYADKQIGFYVKLPLSKLRELEEILVKVHAEGEKNGQNITQ
jgi:hypothetical protein